MCPQAPELLLLLLLLLLSCRCWSGAVFFPVQLWRDGIYWSQHRLLLLSLVLAVIPRVRRRMLESRRCFADVPAERDKAVAHRRQGARHLRTGREREVSQRCSQPIELTAL